MGLKAFWYLVGYEGNTRAQDWYNIYSFSVGKIVYLHSNENVFVRGTLTQSSSRRLIKT